MTIKVTYNVTDVYVSETVSATYINVSYETPSGAGAVWGTITGTLSNQTDLYNALNAKFDDPTGTTLQYLRGDGTLATFPSLTGFVPYTGATANVDLGTHTILAQNATIASSGSGNTATITHSSGSGIGLNITKGGNGEGLYINKTSGSGDAATIIGTLNATTLVKSGGTSSQFLMADGSTSTLTNPITGTGVAGQVAYWSGTNTQVGSNNLFWDATNNRLGIGDTTPDFALSIIRNENTSSGYEIQNNSTGAAANAGIVVRNSATSGQLFKLSTGYGGYKTLQVSDLGFYNAGAGDISILNEASGGKIKFLAGNIATTAQMTLTANGRLLLGSTTEGTQLLQVNGTGYFASNVSIGTTVSTPGYLRNYSTIPVLALQNITTGTADIDGFQLSVSGSLAYVWQYENAAMLFATNATERMRLTSTGNLHIGTFVSDTGEKIQVTGTAKVTGAATFSSSVQAGGGTTNASAILQADSTTKGFLPPRMTTTQINAIATPSEGLQVYNTTINHMCFYMNGAWAKISHSPM